VSESFLPAACRSPPNSRQTPPLYLLCSTLRPNEADWVQQSSRISARFSSISPLTRQATSESAAPALHGTVALGSAQLLRARPKAHGSECAEKTQQAHLRAPPVTSVEQPSRRAQFVLALG